MQDLLLCPESPHTVHFRTFLGGREGSEVVAAVPLSGTVVGNFLLSCTCVVATDDGCVAVTASDAGFGTLGVRTSQICLQR